MSTLGKKLIGEGMDVRTVLSSLELICNPPADSLLESRLKRWDRAMMEIFRFCIRQQDAGTAIPDDQVPDLTSSGGILSEAHMKTLAAAASEFVKTHVVPRQ